jgi:hypothetical protein
MHIAAYSITGGGNVPKFPGMGWCWHGTFHYITMIHSPTGQLTLVYNNSVLVNCSLMHHYQLGSYVKSAIIIRSL